MQNSMPLKFLLKTSLVIAGVILAYSFSVFIGGLHCAVTGECSADLPSVGFTPYIGFILGYIFFISAFLSGFGGRGKYWWLIFFVGPAMLWSLSAGSYSIVAEFFSIFCMGIFIGTLANKALIKLDPAFMAKIS